MRKSLIAALFGLFLAGCTGTSVLESGLGPLSSATSQYSSVNDVRRKFGLSVLQRDPILQRMAREQSRLMAKHLKMTHNTTRGQRFSQRLKRAGYRRLAAENLAEGYKTRGETMDAWVRSKAHRRNMLNPRMKRYGLGVVETNHPTRGKRKYWTLVLGG